MFEHFYMGLFIHCLDKFTALTSSRLAKQVKELTLMADALPANSRYPEAIDHAYRLPSTDRAKWEASIDNKIVRK